MQKLIAKLVSAGVPNKRLRKKIRHRLEYMTHAAQRISHNFEQILGYPLNLKHPRRFNEKINWLKLNYKNPSMATCADKYRVREYIRDKNLGHILIPLLAWGRRFDDLNWEQLPNEFVLKTNHDSGSVWIVKDKKRQDKAVLRREICKALSETFGFRTHELHYTHIPPVVIAEKYLADNGREPIDYKLFCFNGAPHYVQVDFDRFTNHTRSFYDLDWNKLDFFTNFPLAKKAIERPRQLSEMIAIAKVLSEGFPFVRVDLYDVNDTVYFGELTFFPAAGMEKFSDYKWDQKMGDLLKLPMDSE